MSKDQAIAGDAAILGHGQLKRPGLCPAVREVPGLVSAEFFTRTGLDILVAHAGLVPPLPVPAQAYLLLEAAGPGALDTLADVIGDRRPPSGSRRPTAPGCGPTGNATRRRPGFSASRSSSMSRCPPHSGCGSHPRRPPWSLTWTRELTSLPVVNDHEALIVLHAEQDWCLPGSQGRQDTPKPFPDPGRRRVIGPGLCSCRLRCHEEQPTRPAHAQPRG